MVDKCCRASLLDFSLGQIEPVGKIVGQRLLSGVTCPWAGEGLCHCGPVLPPQGLELRYSIRPRREFRLLRKLPLIENEYRYIFWYIYKNAKSV